MPYQPRSYTAIKRTTLVLLFLFAMGSSAMAVTNKSRVSPRSASLECAISSAGLTAKTIGDQQHLLAPPQQSSSPTPTPTPTPAANVGISAAADKSSQVAQGKQYGQPGFVGEPINLNVVNADIRDILNYITEQYGVNFVIDSSVGAVAVTVNVQDVPWNVALDAVLRANRLGIEATGDILRVAMNDVLAKEASTQRVINDSRLDASPLVTEFIRLNYARGSGTLDTAAGGGSSTGTASQSLSSGVGSNSTGSGDQGILPIIQRRLSRRGSIEVEGRSNTLIVTDVRENIEAIRQLITLLDQPEPQVEIETRIVIANRTFSRDLGVQLSAAAINLGTGGQGSFSNLPGGTTGGTGVQLPINPPLGNRSLFGIPGGINGAPTPSAANSLIGLTTGIFGTAQISALITAGETKGNAKTVATPRVTTLNNRKATITSGSFIPVVTPGTLTSPPVTTFVEVPLKLEVIPQITDAGTVVLRIKAENSTINFALANSLGNPGIDKQTVDTEVLVPDGGTTVIGGVLADSEGNSQTRTPGLGGIPVIGNLFKRKNITRTSNEILFFISPRIYRPDYQGRPTTGTVGTGTRSTTIAQPVPLGNPPSNTPLTPPQTPEQQQIAVPVPVQPMTGQPAPRP